MNDMNWAFCIIKPDAMERGFLGPIITRIEQTFLRISALQMRQKNAEWAKQHYDDHVDKDYFDKLVAFMTARSIVGFVVSGPHAINRLRALVGGTQSWNQPAGTIRGDWGAYPAMYNLIHVSDSPECAERELKLFTDITTDEVFSNAS